MSDLGLTLGDGVFETLTVLNSRPRFLDRHLERLQHSADLIKLTLDRSSDLEQTILTYLQNLTLKDCRLRITCTGGEAAAPLSREPGHTNTILTTSPLILPEPTAKVLLSDLRKDPSAITSKAKTLSYGENIWALRSAQAQGADEALFLNQDGQVCECACANIFFWLDGILHTPPLSAGCLPGVTRELTLELAKKNGFRVVEEPLEPAILKNCEAAFLTSSIRRVQPISELGERALETGPTEVLRTAYLELLRFS